MPATCGVAVILGCRQIGLSSAKGFILEDIQHRRRQMAVVQGRDQILFDQVLAPATLITAAPLGNCANSLAFRMPVVSAVSGSTQTRMSHCARKAGSSSAPAKLLTPGADLRVRLQPET